jgi:hypothetical protein
MAKHSPVAEAPVAVAEAPAAAAVAATEAPAAPVADERYKKIAIDTDAATFAGLDASKVGENINRIDFIRSAWTIGKKSRGDIARELTRLADRKVTYQIVFSATKGIAGGPDAATATATPATPAPVEAPAVISEDSME